MSGTWEADEAIDDAAAKAFFAEFGDAWLAQKIFDDSVVAVWQITQLERKNRSTSPFG